MKKMKKNFSSGIICFVITSSLLGGCAATAEKPQQLDMNIPDVWQNSAAGQTAWPDSEWWKAFQSSELDSLITEALNNNRDLKMAAARLAQAQAMATIAGASLYPTIALTTDAQRAKTAGEAAKNKYGIGAQASYELDLRGVNRHTSLAADSAVLSSTYGREAVRVALIAKVADTYFQILSLNDRIEVALRNLVNARKLKQLMEAQNRFGKVSIFELERQKTQVANIEAAIPPLIQQNQIARNALAVLLGKNPGENKTLMPSLQPFLAQGAANALTVSPAEQDMENSKRNGAGLDASNTDNGAPYDIHLSRAALAKILNNSPGDAFIPSLRSLSVPVAHLGQPSQLLERRPDIRRAEADLNAAHANVAAARAAFLPQLTLNGKGGVEGNTLHSVFNSGSGFYSITLELLATIFDGGKRAGQVELAVARRTELVEAYRNSISSAFREVEDALVSVQQLTAQENAHIEEIEHARTAYKLAAIRFRAGSVDYTALLDTERALLNAEAARDQARFGRFSSLVSLYHALGGGLR